MNFKRILNQAFWIILACGVGIGGAVGATGEEGIDTTKAALAALAYAGLRIGLQWYAANAPKHSAAKKLLGFVGVCAALSVAGCATSSFKEKTYDGATGEIASVTKSRSTAVSIPGAKAQQTHSMEYVSTAPGKWDLKHGADGQSEGGDLHRVLADMMLQGFVARTQAQPAQPTNDGPSVLELFDLVTGIGQRLGLMETQMKGLAR